MKWIIDIFKYDGALSSSAFMIYGLIALWVGLLAVMIWQLSLKPNDKRKLSNNGDITGGLIIWLLFPVFLMPELIMAGLFVIPGLIAFIGGALKNGGVSDN